MEVMFCCIPVMMLGVAFWAGRAYEADKMLASVLKQEKRNAERQRILTRQQAKLRGDDVAS